MAIYYDLLIEEIIIHLLIVYYLLLTIRVKIWIINLSIIVIYLPPHPNNKLNHNVDAAPRQTC